MAPLPSVPKITRSQHQLTHAGLSRPALPNKDASVFLPSASAPPLHWVLQPAERRMVHVCFPQGTFGVFLPNIQLGRGLWVKPGGSFTLW